MTLASLNTMSDRERILLIEPCNFESYPVGGQLATVVHLMDAFPDRFALVGLCTDDGPVGRWVERRIRGVVFPFFAAGRRRECAQRPILPARLRWYLELRFHRKQIQAFGGRCAFIQAPETLLAVANWHWNSLCFEFPGVENPLRFSRYWYSKLAAAAFERPFFRSLLAADVILAAADTRSIASLIARSRGILAPGTVLQSPTCVDTSIFHPVSQPTVRRQLGLEAGTVIIVCCGRINWGKGWPLILDAFRIFLSWQPQARLLFLGDGEDRTKLERRARELGLSHAVLATGFKQPFEVATYINAADLYVVGSLNEGWSVAMLEALACGKPIVSTEVSGATDLIQSGKNGFVVCERDPLQFATAMRDAMSLADAERISVQIAERFALKHLPLRMASLWWPLSEGCAADRQCLGGVWPGGLAS